MSLNAPFVTYEDPRISTLTENFGAHELDDLLRGNLLHDRAQDADIELCANHTDERIRLLRESQVEFQPAELSKVGVGLPSTRPRDDFSDQGSDERCSNDGPDDGQPTKPRMQEVQ